MTTTEVHPKPREPTTFSKEGEGKGDVFRLAAMDARKNVPKPGRFLCPSKQPEWLTLVGTHSLSGLGGGELGLAFCDIFVRH